MLVGTQHRGWGLGAALQGEGAGGHSGHPEPYTAGCVTGQSSVRFPQDQQRPPKAAHTVMGSALWCFLDLFQICPCAVLAVGPKVRSLEH